MCNCLSNHLEEDDRVGTPDHELVTNGQHDPQPYEMLNVTRNWNILIERGRAAAFALYGGWNLEDEQPSSEEELEPCLALAIFKSNLTGHLEIVLRVLG